jgi:hypothetical protein
MSAIPTLCAVSASIARSAGAARRNAANARRDVVASSASATKSPPESAVAAANVANFGTPLEGSPKTDGAFGSTGRPPTGGGHAGRVDAAVRFDDADDDDDDDDDGFDFFSAWDDRFSDRSPPSRDLPPPRSFQRPPFHRRAIASDGGVVGASAAAAARAHAACSR